MPPDIVVTFDIILSYDVIMIFNAKMILRYYDFALIFVLYHFSYKCKYLNFKKFGQYSRCHKVKYAALPDTPWKDL